MIADHAAVGRLLAQFERVAIAVSGGIDSLTLATIAGRTHAGADMFHAVSPAVPPEATARVREFAVRESWRLHLLDAQEFGRQEYVSNPVNRCFFCKQSLYAAISAIAKRTSAQIVSGTNADDLHEYRPGLEAARERAVRHPFAELGVAKPGIRSMASALDLGAVADLPSSPCLSSRVETGIRIDASMLGLIHASENAIRAHVRAAAVRCRIRQAGIVIEIDTASLSALTETEKRAIEAAVGDIFASDPHRRPIFFSPYRTGSAFLVNQLA